MSDDEFPAVGAYEVMVRRYLQPRVAALPSDRDGFLRELLGLCEDLTKRGHPSPEVALATAMGVPVETTRDALGEASRRRNTAGS